jgi:hypothetical protein
MNPTLIGLSLVVGVALIGVVLAAHGGMLKSVGRQQTVPPLETKHPVVIEMSVELSALDALPISTKEERLRWEAARRVFDKKLRTVWSSVYDSLPHEIEHYLDDVDIRAKDSAYAKNQREKLSALLTRKLDEPNQSPEPTAPSGRGSS